jgi:hypothetical protein
MIEVGFIQTYQENYCCELPGNSKRAAQGPHAPVGTRDRPAHRSQMPIEEKVKYADFVIDTSGPLERTRQQVERFINDWRLPDGGHF